MASKSAKNPSFVFEAESIIVLPDYRETGSLNTLCKNEPSPLN